MQDTTNGIKEISGSKNTRAIDLFGPSYPVVTMAANRPKAKPCTIASDDADISHSYRDLPANTGEGPTTTIAEETNAEEPTENEPDEVPTEANNPYLDHGPITSTATAKPTRSRRLERQNTEDIRGGGKMYYVRCSYKWVPYAKGVWQPKVQASGEASASSGEAISPAVQRSTGSSSGQTVYRRQRSTDDLEVLVREDDLETARPTKMPRQ